MDGRSTITIIVVKLKIKIKWWYNNNHSNQAISEMDGRVNQRWIERWSMLPSTNTGWASGQTVRDGAAWSSSSISSTSSSFSSSSLTKQWEMEQLVHHHHHFHHHHHNHFKQQHRAGQAVRDGGKGAVPPTRPPSPHHHWTEPHSFPRGGIFRLHQSDNKGLCWLLESRRKTILFCHRYIVDSWVFTRERYWRKWKSNFEERV